MTEEDYKSAIARNLTRYRKMRGLSQTDLARLLGMEKPNNVNNWEREVSSMSASTLFKVCDALNISADELGGRRTDSTSLEDKRFISAFHSANPGIKEGVCKLLDILPAKKGDNGGTISEEQFQADLNNTIIMEDPIS